MKTKYARLYKLREMQQQHGDLSSRLVNARDKKDYAELSSIIEADKEDALREFQENPILRDFRATIKQRFGYDIKTD